MNEDDLGGGGWRGRGSGGDALVGLLDGLDDVALQLPELSLVLGQGPGTYSPHGEGLNVRQRIPL